MAIDDKVFAAMAQWGEATVQLRQSDYLDQENAASSQLRVASRMFVAPAVVWSTECGLVDTPIDPLVADIVKQLDENLREDFEERAGIMEFDAGIPRGHAGCLALLDVLHRHPEVLSGVITPRVELDGAAQYWLTTDLSLARGKLTEIGGVEVGVRNLPKLINENYGGIALVTAIR